MVRLQPPRRQTPSPSPIPARNAAGTPTTKGATSRRIRPAGRRSSGTSSAFPGPSPTGLTPQGASMPPTAPCWPSTREPPEPPERSMPGAWCKAVPPTVRLLPLRQRQPLLERYSRRSTRYRRCRDRSDYRSNCSGNGLDGGLVPEIGDILPVSIEETSQLLPVGRTQKRAFTASRCQGWVCDPGPDTECLFYALSVSVLPERYLIVRCFSLSPSFGTSSGSLGSRKWLQDDKRDAL